jgi:hypothetical protein
MPGQDKNALQRIWLEMMRNAAVVLHSMVEKTKKVPIDFRRDNTYVIDEPPYVLIGDMGALTLDGTINKARLTNWHLKCWTDILAHIRISMSDQNAVACMGACRECIQLPSCTLGTEWMLPWATNLYNAVARLYNIFEYVPYHMSVNSITGCF